MLGAKQADGGDTDANDDAHGGSGHGQGLGPLALGALGVVFGDIGTSPLYAFREAFEHQHLPVVRANAMGLASLAFWALIMIISIKYLSLVMRADNRGEGGILALTALVMPTEGQARGRRTAILVLLGVFGTALLYGDGLITPAISVLSAVEGFKVASSAFDRFVLPIACVILIGLFAVQRRGTGGIGKVFGPVMVVWFGVLGVLGISQIVHQPGVLAAVNPIYIVRFFEASPMRAFLSLGSIFLVVTGGEALYADMGHFGRKPIATAWYSLVLPGLLLCYFGQAALLIRDPSAIESPFYRMAPAWAITPLAILATLATVIASQALISGAFSLTVQAVQLDYLPRLKVTQTSGQHQGQVYVPMVNWLLLIGCLGLVLGFRTSSNLAAAYGIAVTTTMVITSLIFYVVTRNLWGWSAPKALLSVAPLLFIDTAFLAGNIPKIPEGGWFPVLVALALLLQMTTWRRGRELVAARIQRGDKPIRDVLNRLDRVERVAGTAVFLFKDLGMAPPALISNMRHNKVVHETTLIVSVATVDVPRADPAERCYAEEIAPGVHQILLRYGFMEEPNVPAALAGCTGRGFRFKAEDATYFIGRESVVAGKAPGMHPLLEHLFVLLNRGADSASRFFGLPAERVFEVGTQVEL
ncbi:MAG TPA: potassium transporter Kup [Acidimicrobiales bacterium]|nr:potassium transporter Kup [Acidimicrobiales bacterium]